MKIKISDKNKKRLIALLLIVLCVSLSINVIILKEKPCFGAVDLEEYKETKNGDPIVMTFGGNEYAVMVDEGRYVFTLRNFYPLTKLRTADYLKSVIDYGNVRTVSGVEDDPDNLFLECSYYNIYTEIGSSYSVFGPPVGMPAYLYRADYEIPELSVENVESIEFYVEEEENSGPTKVFSETDKENIKKWINSYEVLMTEDYFYDGETDKTVYDVYAKFNGVCLRYDLGEFALDDFEISEFLKENVEAIDFYKYDENRDEIKVYMETDKANIEKWLNNYESFESTDNGYGMLTNVYKVCAKSVDEDLSYFLGYFKINNFEKNKFPEQKQP